MAQKPNRIARRGVPANLLEIPMHLAVVSWAAIMMGMSGHDLRTFYMLRQHLSATSAANQLKLDSNGMTNVDTAWVVIGALTFIWGLVALGLSGFQFKGRRGSYSGRGTAWWAFTGIVYFLLLIIWLALTAAYTYYASNKSYALTALPDLQEPLSEPVRFLAYQIHQSIWQGYAQSLFVPQSLDQLGIGTQTLGPWGTVTSVAAVNSLAIKYEHILFYRAQLICCWFALATMFCTWVLHVALPFVLKSQGWTREEGPTEEEEALNPARLEQKDYYPYPTYY